MKLAKAGFKDCFKSDLIIGVIVIVATLMVDKYLNFGEWRRGRVG
jgi:hypothetical protein